MLLIISKLSIPDIIYKYKYNFYIKGIVIEDILNYIFIFIIWFL